MAIRVSRRRRRVLGMTSLIDVIFLLLLFFMLSSTFSRFGEIELSGAAQAGSATPDVTTHFLSVGAGDLRLDGAAIPAEALIQALSGEASRRVLIGLAPDVTAQRLIDVLAILRGVQALQVTVLQ